MKTKSEEYDYKQIAYKLQDDLDTIEFHKARYNADFLKKLIKVAKKGFFENDFASREYAMKMLEDWLDEEDKKNRILF